MNNKEKLLDLIEINKKTKYSGYTPARKKDNLIDDLLENELKIVESTDTYDELLFLNDIAHYLKNNNINYYCNCGMSYSSILYILGVTFANPFPPHLYYTKTKNIVWYHDLKDGFDLDIIKGTIRDGHNLLSPIMLYGNQLYCKGMKDLYIDDNYKTKFTIEVEDEYFYDLNEVFKHHWYMSNNNYQTTIGYTSVPGTNGKEKEHTYTKFGNITVGRSSSEKNMMSLMFCYKWPDKPKSFSEYLAWWSLRGKNSIIDIDRKMMKNNYQLSDLIVYEDDIYDYQIKHSVNSEESFINTRLINLGKIKELPFTNEMINSDDKWKLDRINNMHKYEPIPQYRFKKGDNIERLLYELRKLKIDYNFLFGKVIK